MKEFDELEKKIGIFFKKKALLNTAFIHKSYVNEHRGDEIESNERLEFLGDAVLELAATNHLFRKYPNKAEGEMTSFRSALVKGKNLAKIAEELELGEHLHLSQGENNSGGRKKKYILANTLEALIGAIYVDKGYEVAAEFIAKFILTELDEIVEQGLYIDSKSRLQELVQEKEDFTPFYETISDDGPDHNKIFTMGVYVHGKLVETGKGSSKQKAEEDAATNALKKLGYV